MFFAKSVTNPALGGAIEIMRTENTVQSREKVMEEILRATYLCPVNLSIAPVPNEEGVLQLQDGCEIRPIMVRDNGGRPLLLAFTNSEDVKRWREKTTNKDFHCFGMTFLEYTDMMLRKLPDGSYGPAQGFVIDPCGHNMIVDRDMVANIMLRLTKRNDL